MRSRTVRCIDCGREIFTIGHAISIEGAPVVCRKCFGVQTYAGVRGKVWVYTSNIVPPAAATTVD